MLRSFLVGRTSIAPLITLRVAFGVLMCAALVRFRLHGWIDSLYVAPAFHFPYPGMEWVRPLSGTGMHLIFHVMTACAVLIALGLFYRVAIIIFFLLFTYVELIDAATYLNHYYFVSLVAFLLCFMPAHRALSLDVGLRIAKPLTEIPLALVRVLQLQIGLVYFFAGLAKINGDWLLHAMPLRIWLHARSDLPVIGPLLQEPWMAYLCSWSGMLFDTTIAFLLFNRRTAIAAYGVTVVFHALTAILFPGIGMFPYLMIAMALIFIPPNLHVRMWTTLGWRPAAMVADQFPGRAHGVLFGAWITIQCLLPMRYLIYPGRLFYNEYGYRFSWRVMLMEKAGMVLFTVKDPTTGDVLTVDNKDYLTVLQEKQMTTQPDLILQFAHHLAREYSDRIAHPQVFAEGYVSVNGRGGRPFIDPTVDLAQERHGAGRWAWVLDE